MKPKPPDLIPVPYLWDDGNALAIIGKCQKAARRAGWAPQLIEAFKAEATSGDFDHVLQTVMRYFDQAHEEDE